MADDETPIPSELSSPIAQSDSGGSSETPVAGEATSASGKALDTAGGPIPAEDTRAISEALREINLGDD